MHTFFHLNFPLSAPHSSHLFSFISFLVPLACVALLYAPAYRYGSRQGSVQQQPATAFNYPHFLFRFSLSLRSICFRFSLVVFLCILCYIFNVAFSFLCCKRNFFPIRKYWIHCTDAMDRAPVVAVAHRFALFIAVCIICPNMSMFVAIAAAAALGRAVHARFSRINFLAIILLLKYCCREKYYFVYCGILATRMNSDACMRFGGT